MTALLAAVIVPVIALAAAALVVRIGSRADREFRRRQSDNPFDVQWPPHA